MFYFLKFFIILLFFKFLKLKKIYWNEVCLEITEFLIFNWKKNFFKSSFSIF